MITNRSINWLLDDCCLYHSTNEGKATLDICELVGNLAYHAMMLEVYLTPKPGLVDGNNTGSHADMDLALFVESSKALRPYMKQFVRVGYRKASFPARDLLPFLRKVGIKAESAMYKATDGVNTHKGMIFTIGLICGSVGWLYKRGLSYDAQRVRAVIKECCASLVSDELKNKTSPPSSAGERIYQDYGIGGIRAEAAQGYPTIFNEALPRYEQIIGVGQSEQFALSQTLLSLMANNTDTNLIHRGGIEGLKLVQSEAEKLLAQNIESQELLDKKLDAFDKKLIKQNLSPGGSADLLAATWLLAQLNICSSVLITKAR